MPLSPKEQDFEERFRRKLAAPKSAALWGLAACALLTCLAFYLCALPFPPFTVQQTHPLSAVLLAFVLGLVLRSTIPSGALLKPGVNIVIKRFLPLGIILLGARLDFYDLIRVGGRVLFGAMVLIVVIILLTRYLSRLLSVGPTQGLLIGVGTAICGTSAIVATAPVVESSERDMAISIAAVNLLGVLAMFLFPIAGGLLGLPPESFGEWCGLAIHATPQVIAAGFAHPLEPEIAGETATVVKLARISLLGPVVFVIGMDYARRRRRRGVFLAQAVKYRDLVPAFILFFLGMSALRTLGLLPEITLHMSDRFLFGAGDRTLDLAAALGDGGKWMITAAIAGVGLMTEFRAIRQAGVRPFVLGLLASGLLAGLGLLYAVWR